MRNKLQIVATAVILGVCALVVLSCGSPNQVAVDSNFTVSFDKNSTDATGTMAALTIAKGAKKALTANSFTRTGYTFSGWAVSASGTVVYADKAEYTMESANVTLYAQWTALTADKAAIKTAIKKLPEFKVVLPNSIAANSGARSFSSSRATSFTGNIVIWDALKLASIADYKPTSFNSIAVLQNSQKNSYLNIMVNNLKTYIANKDFTPGQAADYSFIWMDAGSGFLTKGISKIQINQKTSLSYDVYWSILLFNGDTVNGCTSYVGFMQSHISISNDANGKLIASIDLASFTSPPTNPGATSFSTSIADAGSVRLDIYGYYDELSGKMLTYSKETDTASDSLVCYYTTIESALDETKTLTQNIVATNSSKSAGSTTANYLWANSLSGAIATCNSYPAGNQTTQYREDYFDTINGKAGNFLMAKIGTATSILSPAQAAAAASTGNKFSWPLRYLTLKDTNTKLISDAYTTADSTIAQNFYAVPLTIDASNFNDGADGVSGNYSYYLSGYLTNRKNPAPDGDVFQPQVAYSYDPLTGTSSVANDIPYSWEGLAGTTANNPKNIFEYSLSSRVQPIAVNLANWTDKLVDLTTYTAPVTLDTTSCPAITVSKQTVTDTKLVFQ